MMHFNLTYLDILLKPDDHCWILLSDLDAQLEEISQSYHEQMQITMKKMIFFFWKMSLEHLKVNRRSRRKKILKGGE